MPILPFTFSAYLSFKGIRSIIVDWLKFALLMGFLGWLLIRGAEELGYQWQWYRIPRYLFEWQDRRFIVGPLIQGVGITLQITLISLVLALVTGLMVALARLSSSIAANIMSKGYLETVRNMPPLVLVFIFYYFIGDQLLPRMGLDRWAQDLGPHQRNLVEFFFGPLNLFVPFLSALITLALFEGAYIAEIIRAGILSIEQGQWEAASALGMTPWARMRHIILPQAVPRMLPPLGGQFISTIKDSAIVSVISIQELTFQAMELMASTYLTFEIWITTTGLYLLLTFSCSLTVSRIEHRIRRRYTNQ